MLCPDCKQPMLKSADHSNHCMNLNCPPNRTQCPECQSDDTQIQGKNLTEAQLSCGQCAARWTISRIEKA